jgi:hypothetical protein
MREEDNTMHELQLIPEDELDNFPGDPEHTLTSLVTAATANALAGARVESLRFFPEERDVYFWRGSATLLRPGDRSAWREVAALADLAGRYAPRTLYRNPQGGSATRWFTPSHRDALVGHPSPAEAFQAEIQRMMTALGITFAAYEPLQRVLSYFGWEPLVGCVDLHRTGFDEPFTTLDRLTQNADPLLTPLENLHEGITRELNRLEIRLLPSTNDNPTVDPGSDAANAIIRDVTTIGALLLGDHSLADLQRFRDRAPARYAEITGSRDLSDFDRQFLAEHPPGAEPYFDVMLGACHGKGSRPCVSCMPAFSISWRPFLSTARSNGLGIRSPTGLSPPRPFLKHSMHGEATDTRGSKYAYATDAKDPDPEAGPPKGGCWRRQGGRRADHHERPRWPLHRHRHAYQQAAGLRPRICPQRWQRSCRAP